MTADPNEALPEEIQRATSKFKKRDAGIVKAHGPAASAHARAVTSKWLPVLTKGLARVLKDENEDPAIRVFLSMVRELDGATLALCLLQGALQGIGQKGNYRDAAFQIAGNIYTECFAAGLFKNYHDERIREVPQSRAQKRLSTIAAYADFKMKNWRPDHRLRAGTWGIGQLLELLPGVFDVDTQLPYKKDPRSKERTPEKVLVLTPAARAYAESNVAELIRKNPVWLPKPEAPAKWEDWDKGGTSEKRLAGALCIVSNCNKGTDAARAVRKAVRKAIRNGTMKPTVGALNALQAVPWAINTQLLDVVRECALQKVEVEGVPRDDDAERVMFEMDMHTADAMTKHDRFYTAMNLDWRGRVYGIPSFNFQRDDRVRALFLFAEGEPIGYEGLRWLKVHVANCGDFGKISKRPFEDRVQWVNEHREKIENIVAAPLQERWWTKADNPFQFLAACFELSSALAYGPAFVSRLPISFDGSCSGLQHLSAMTRDKKTAKLVNLTPQAVPEDIYQTVAERVKKRVVGDQEDEDTHLAQMWLKHGIDRKHVKRNVMTYFYSSSEWGMAEQQRDDLMRPLAEKVKSGELKEHPFGADDGNKAAKYLVEHTHQTIEKEVKRPALAMEFLQKLAKAMAHEDLPLQWTTPTGFPWSNRYYKQKERQVRLNQRGVSFRILIATGEEEPEIDRRAAKSGVAPNFVHACDAAHLLLTVNAAVAEGITSLATVHDSFGCLPSRAERFRQIIREQFVKLYEENDVLAQVLQSARKDLGENAKGLPAKPPEPGALDIVQVLQAEYAFA